MEKICVCYVSRELYPHQKSGIASYIYHSANVLQENDHEVIIVTDKSNDIIDMENHFNNIQIFYVEVQSRWIDFFKCYNTAYAYAVYLLMVKLQRNISIDIIETSDYFGEAFFLLLAKDAGLIDAEINLKLHTPSYECNLYNRASQLNNIYTDLEDACIKLSKNISAASIFLKKIISKRLNKNNIEVVYNFSSLGKNQKVDLSSEKNIIFVGRIQYLKGVNILIRAIEEIINNSSTLDNFNFLFIGKDWCDDKSISHRSEIKCLIKEQNLSRYQFLEPIEQNELNALFNRSYVTICPSYYEGFGNVCLEAMSNGCPVIVSSDTGLEEIVSNSLGGIIFNNGDLNSLKDAIIDIVTNEEQRNVYANNALKQSEKFNNEIIYNYTFDYYIKLIKSKQNNSNEFYKSLFLFIEKTFDTFIELERVTANWSELSSRWGELEIYIKQLESNKIIVDNTYKELQNRFKQVDEEFKLKFEFQEKLISKLNSDMNDLNFIIGELNWTINDYAIKEKEMLIINSDLIKKTEDLEESLAELNERNRSLEESYMELNVSNINLEEEYEQLINNNKSIKFIIKKLYELLKLRLIKRS